MYCFINGVGQCKCSWLEIKYALNGGGPAFTVFTRVMCYLKRYDYNGKIDRLGYLVINEKSELELCIVVEQAAVGTHCGDDYYALLFALECLHCAHLDLARPELLVFQRFLDFVHLFKMDSLSLCTPV